MNDILARRARRATMGIALSAALVAGIAPATAIAAETSSPTGAAVSQTSAANGNSGAPQTEDAAAAKEKAYAAMQEALKNLEAAKDAASPEKIARFNDDIARFQELRDKMAAQAAELRESLPTMQADIDAAQAKYNEAHNRTSGLQAELKALEALGDEEPSITIKEHIKQLRSEIMAAKAQEDFCETELRERRDGLKRQERRVNDCELAAEKYKAHIDQFIAWRDALLDNLKKAQTAYDDACKAYEEAKAAADKATSPEITKPTETVPPSGSTQPAEATPPTGSSATGKDTSPSSTKQANSSNGKQADTTAGKLANTGGDCCERNRTRSSRRRRPRNNRHSHTPHQELKIADRAFCLHQFTSPETKRGPFPHLRKRASLTAKIQATAPPPLEPRSHQCPDNASKPHSARDRLN